MDATIIIISLPSSLPTYYILHSIKILVPRPTSEGFAGSSSRVLRKYARSSDMTWMPNEDSTSARFEHCDRIPTRRIRQDGPKVCGAREHETLFFSIPRGALYNNRKHRRERRAAPPPFAGLTQPKQAQQIVCML